MPPLWVEQNVHAPNGVAGFQGEQEQIGRHSRRAHVQHWVAYSWEASRMVGKNSYFAQHGDRLYFPMLLLPNLPRPGLNNSFDLRQMGGSYPPQLQRW